MDDNQTQSPFPMQEAPKVVDLEQIRKWNVELERYRAAKHNTNRRIISAENWWKLHNTEQEQEDTETGQDGGFTSQSAWLHNVIVSKHADAMEAYPEPNILPREQGDVQEAKMLSSVIPCVLEYNKFERTYNDVQWDKMKFGTGAYKVYWDKDKWGGLGDIGVESVSILQLYWEPGIDDLQKSRFLFYVERVNRETLIDIYPHLKETLKSDSKRFAEHSKEEADGSNDAVTMVDVYYHKFANGRKILHYARYVEETVLYATENDTQPIIDRNGMLVRDAMSRTGLYNHGKFPFVLDVLFPVANSPAGYGFVDVGRNPQTAIDLMDTGMIKNVVVGSIPRFFMRDDGNVNESEFLDLKKPIVHVPCNVDESNIRQIVSNPLPTNCVNMVERKVNELRETTGNTETSNGNVTGGVTAASAIAALQEASGKGSRDSTKSAYRAYQDVVELCIELVRQFYDLPRKFRIIGEFGAAEFISYSNQGIRPQAQTMIDGTIIGARVPVFDIKISAQKANVYTKVSQNELALQFFQLGFFSPTMAEQALATLEMMDFEGKDAIMQKISKNATIAQKLMFYMQICALYCPDPMIQQQLQQDMAQFAQMIGTMPGGVGQMAGLPNSDNLAPHKANEPGIVRNARERSSTASEPTNTKVIQEGK